MNKKTKFNSGVIHVLKGPEMREYLFRFYIKRKSSFLANVYKAGITSDMKDIHRSRLDAKKLFALFQLFELIDAKTFNKRNHIKHFSDIYRRSGKIREIQVSLLLLERFELTNKELDVFRVFLVNKEKRQTLKLLKSIKQFNEKALRKTDNDVEKICSHLSPATMVSQTNHFLTESSRRVLDICEDPSDTEKIHTVRKELKAMSTICSLLFSMRKDEFLDRVVASLNQNEMIIGDWHDNQILLVFLDKFREQSQNISESTLNRLQKIREVLIAENALLLEKLIPDVLELVRFVVPAKRE